MNFNRGHRLKQIMLDVGPPCQPSHRRSPLPLVALTPAGSLHDGSHYESTDQAIFKPSAT